MRSDIPGPPTDLGPSLKQLAEEIQDYTKRVLAIKIPPDIMAKARGGPTAPRNCARMRWGGLISSERTDMAIIIISLAIVLLLVPAVAALFVLRRAVKAAQTLSNHNG
jgi:hypothetical protein